MGLFEGIIGHGRGKEVLGRMLKNGSMPHALLLVGPDHIGKTAVAQALAREVLGHKGALEVHLDYAQLERETDEKTGKHRTNISVRQVRALVERLAMTSMGGGAKVAFVKEAHRLSAGATNALLKTLEEPKGDMLFLLRAPSVESVAPTIASRCQTLRLSIVSMEEVVDGLVKMGFARSDAQEAATHAQGRPGFAIRFLKDGEYRARMETDVAAARAFFAAALPQRLAMVMQLIPKGEVDGASELARIVDQWQGVCRGELLESLGGEKQEKLVRLLERLASVREAMRHNVNPHLAIEHIALGR